MRKIVNFFTNFFKFYISIFIGAGIFSFYIWLRFIRERLPKDIPLKLSTLGFIILLIICLTYLLIILLTLFPRKRNESFEKLINFLYIPLENFDYHWKHISWINNSYQKLIYWLALKLNFFIVKYPIFYILFYFLPRCILVTTLIIDIFYFHKLVFIYKVLLIGVLLFLRRYIIYSIKMYKKDLIFVLNETLRSIATPYVFGIMPSEWPENYDPEDPDESEYMDSNVMMDLPIDVFINYYIEQHVNNNNIITYRAYDFLPEFYKKQRIIHNVDPNRKYVPDNVSGLYMGETDKKIEKTLYLSLLLEHYNNFSNNNKKVKYIKTFIYLLYLICWSYVLLKSGTIENFQNVLLLIQNLSQCESKYIEEPFSGLYLY